MINFDTILGMDWLAPHHAVLDCYAKSVTISMHRIRPVVWNGFFSRIIVRITSYFLAEKLVVLNV